MIRKINAFLAGIPMTAAAGFFLLLDLVPHLAQQGGLAFSRTHLLPFDPAWVTVLISGLPLVYLAGWRILHNRGIGKISSALLITIAMIAAIAIGDLFAAGEVAFIMAIGAILEERTTRRAQKGLEKLMDLAPVQGRRRKNGKEELVPLSQIRRGDVLRILPGETIPADGTILAGESSVDQSVMTGESLPVDKTVGDAVFCGTINRFGSMDISVDKVGEDSSLHRLIRMMRDAENRQAPMQRIADKAASWLVPAALLIAVFAYVFTGDVVTAVTVLVVFCPCALVLATPTAVMAAIGQAARHGVIIKSGEALEAMGKVDTVAFDKTGTLTCGRLEVSDVLALDTTLDEQTLLALCAAAEARSEHPLGKAIVSCAKARGVSVPESDAFQMEAGRGVSAQVEGKQVLCGSERFLQEHGVTVNESVQKEVQRLRGQGKATLVAAVGRNCAGVIALCDGLRPRARDMVERLKAMHTCAVLLTGDHHRTAVYFARQAGIREVRAELLPEEKVQSIQALQKEGHCVCMIGDGVNDAPALKTADVSVAMGVMGSAIAVDAADIALMSDELSRIPYLKRLSDATVATIRGSIALSMGINFAAIVCSLLGLLNPTTGALVHNAGSCLVVLIAALLYDRNFDV